MKFSDSSVDVTLNFGFISRDEGCCYTQLLILSKNVPIEACYYIFYPRMWFVSKQLWEPPAVGWKVSWILVIPVAGELLGINNDVHLLNWKCVRDWNCLLSEPCAPACCAETFFHVLRIIVLNQQAAKRQNTSTLGPCRCDLYTPGCRDAKKGPFTHSTGFSFSQRRWLYLP